MLYMYYKLRQSFANWKTKWIKNDWKNAGHVHDIYIKITVVLLLQFSDDREVLIELITKCL